MGSLEQPHSWALSLYPFLLGFCCFRYSSQLSTEEFSLGSGVALCGNCGLASSRAAGTPTSGFMCYHCCQESNRTCVLLLGSLPSCPGLVCSQLLEERPSDSPPSACPAQCASSCFHVSSPLARCLSLFYTKAKNWLQEGVKQQCSHPVLWTLERSHTLQLVSQPWKEIVLKA